MYSINSSISFNRVKVIIWIGAVLAPIFCGFEQTVGILFNGAMREDLINA